MNELNTMKKSKTRNYELQGLSEYRLNKMWHSGEIAKCPRCHHYYKQHKEQFLYNVGLCDHCTKENEELQKTIEIMESW